MHSVLTIASSDSSSGAGIQADLKTLSYLGIHCCTAIVAVTAQNTQKVCKIYPLPSNIIEAQIDSIFEDFKIKGIKTGMLYSENIVKVVAEKITEKFENKKYGLPLVVDTVFQATVGGKLHKKNLLESMKKYLIPLATVVTPNIEEAVLLSGRKINTIADIEEVCKNIYDLGPQYVLIKGGHLKGKYAIDFLYDGIKLKKYISRRVGKIIHGAGCVYSSLITGYLALGKGRNAFEYAKKTITEFIASAYKAGKGVSIINVLSRIEIKNYEKESIKKDLKNAVEKLASELPLGFIPDVGINFVYALPFAHGLEEVCGIKNRLSKNGEKISYGDIEFGASKHMATVVLTAMKYDSSVRCALNIKYLPEIVSILREKYSVGSFERWREPKGRSTMEWSTEYVIKKMGYVPDVIYDLGSEKKYEKKEPMVRILGKNPNDVFKKLEYLIERFMRRRKCY